MPDVTFAGVTASTIPGFYVEQVRRKLLGKVRHTFLEVPGREGAWLFPEKKGMKEITLVCSVLVEGGVYPTDRRTALNLVADWADKAEMNQLISSDEPDRFTWAVLSTEPDVEEWRHHGSFELVFLADPYNYALSPTVVELTATVPNYSTTFAITDTIDAYPIIEIEAVGGDLREFELTVNGYKLIYHGSVAGGSTFTINALNYTTSGSANTDLELTGAFNAVAIDMRDVEGQFPVLVAGVTQQLSLAAGIASTATSANLTISWRRRFR